MFSKLNTYPKTVHLFLTLRRLFGCGKNQCKTYHPFKKIATDYFCRSCLSYKSSCIAENQSIVYKDAHYVGIAVIFICQFSDCCFLLLFFVTE